MTAVAAAYGADQLGNKAALTDSFSAAFLGAAAIALAGAALALVTIRTPKPNAGAAPADATTSAT